MLGFSGNSGIPQARNVPNMKLLSYLHKRAVENDRRAKLRMQAEYDSRMRAKECTIAVGCKVLIKQERVNKSTSPWDPKPFLVTNVNGSMITAAGHDKVTTRNSSFLMPYRPEEGERIACFSTKKPKTISHSQQINPDIIIERRELMIQNCACYSES